MLPTTLAVSDAALDQTLAIITTPLLKQNGAAFWFLKNNKEIKIWSDLLHCWQNNLNNFNKKIYTWPEQEDINPEIFLAYQQNKDCLILTTISNLETLVPDWHNFQKNSIALSLGQTYTLSDLSRDLIKIAWTRETQASQNFSFSIRGQIVDLYQNYIIYRLEYNFNEISGIQEINTLTNETKNIDKLILWPAEIVNKQKFLNSLKEHNLLIYDAEYKNLFIDFKNSQIIIDPLAKKTDFNFTSQSLSSLFDQGQDKIKLLKSFPDYEIFWFSKNLSLAQNIINEHKLKVKLIDWQRALSWPDAKLIAKQKIITVCDQIFFLVENSHTNQTSENWLPEFNIGDLVVHRDHGIAKLKDHKTMLVDGQEIEYLVLQYAASDTLFVPLDRLDKVEKYLGPPNPKINRLSIDNTWPQTLRKIKSQTVELANQLLITEATRKLHPAVKLPNNNLSQEINNSFPYKLTPSQTQAWQDVQNDLINAWPADRLIAGDVGFGKTEIALRAAAATAANGYQTVLLCPTTILAQQHFDNFEKRLSKFGIRVALLTRWQSSKEIQTTLTALKNKEIDIIIGTHRLLSKDVIIPALQLLIIDEEQNFGVADKEKLKKYKSNIHVLTLTATPIPRTLHLALSMIKDISLITDPIRNRKNIITEVLPEQEEIVVKAISQELKRQGQVYFLHNRVETIDFAYKKLAKLFPKSRIAIAHGQLADEQLAHIMHQFDTGQIDILVCSTIIANGLDIPSANTLIVTEATRFGLSQLHQLRGRIGRSDIQAYAYFLYSAEKLSGLPALRLRQLKQASSLGDGFKIASRDLELRGVGQILGKAQSGKVKTIGLGMYQNLIAETINELKGQVNKVWRDIEIKLPLETNLPDKNFDNLVDKINFYQKVSRQKDLNTIENNIQTSGTDALKNIWQLQKIKVLAQATNIVSINSYLNQNKQYLSINFLGEADFKKIDKILNVQTAWQYHKQQLKIIYENTKAFKLNDLITAIQTLGS